MDEQTEVTRRVKEAVVRGLGLQVLPAELGDDDALFGAGTGADPVACLEIVLALEEEFAIRIEDEELHAAIFDSVRSLAELVQRTVETAEPQP